MKRLPWIHIVLFLLTFFTTLLAGAFYGGANVFSEPWRILEGLPFSLSLLLILLSHEFSHYFASRLHRMKATLPYFIPAPTLIGTLGAVIRMKSPIITRKALIDIGASGPIAGFVISIMASAIGLGQSSVMDAGEVSGAIGLGNSVVFSGLSRLILGVPPEGHDIVLHPVAFAGWIGLFITSLNLIPVGQLDGGHIAYAFLGERHKVLSVSLIAVLVFLGVFYWEGWMLWAALMVLFGLRHPPVMYWEKPLDPKRRLAGLVSFVIFIITFIPLPFEIIV